MVDFSHKRRITEKPNIKIGEAPIQYRTKATFLGLTFDQKLNWNEHIQKLKVSCLKTMNALKYLNNRNRGLDRNRLLGIYHTLIRSKIDYGSQLYCTAAKSLLKNLDVIHNACLRLCSGAFPTSPVISVYCDLSEPPLHFRRLQLSSNFYIKNLDHPENPISTLFLNTDIKSIFIKSQKQNLLLPLYLSKNNIPTKFHPLLPIVTHTPPWLLELPHTVFDLLETKKAPSNNFEIQNQLSEILNSRFKDATRCYTDGSKTN